MSQYDEEDVVFQYNALDVVSTWLLHDDKEKKDDEDNTTDKTMQYQKKHQPVTLYRLSSSSVPSLTRPNAVVNVDVTLTLTEREREMKRKLLRKHRSNYIDEVISGEQEAQKQQDEVQDEEEQELVRQRTHTSDNRKRKRTAQDELLDQLREDASRKKIKNLKRKLQLQRKKHEQRVLKHNDINAAGN